MISVRGFHLQLIPHWLPNKIPLKKTGFHHSDEMDRSLTEYAIFPRKTEYQQVVKALLEIT